MTLATLPFFDEWCCIVYRDVVVAEYTLRL